MGMQNLGILEGKFICGLHTFLQQHAHKYYDEMIAVSRGWRILCENRDFFKSF